MNNARMLRQLEYHAREMYNRLKGAHRVALRNDAAGDSEMLELLLRGGSECVAALYPEMPEWIESDGDVCVANIAGHTVRARVIGMNRGGCTLRWMLNGKRSSAEAVYRACVVKA